MLNINSAGKLNVYGETKEVDAYITSEAKAAMLAARRANREFKSGDELPTIVVIGPTRRRRFTC